MSPDIVGNSAGIDKAAGDHVPGAGRSRERTRSGMRGMDDLPAGKIHALLTRDYTKGRDIYDLLWYRSRQEPVEPNIEMLNNALQQTGWEGPTISNQNWKSAVKDKLKTLAWEEVAQDVEPFLENPEETRMLTCETLISTL